MCYVFKDYYQNTVKLSLAAAKFSAAPKHVWVICRYHDKWLLTSHKRRGLEFPGGKVEAGETAEQAAIREVKEETGAHVKQLKFIGQYEVIGKGDTIVKNIYYAEIETIAPQSTYFETNGPVLLTELPSNIKEHNEYSFIMKDEVIIKSLQYINEHIRKGVIEK